jgi:hypothetical protein
MSNENVKNQENIVPEDNQITSGSNETITFTNVNNNSVAISNLNKSEEVKNSNETITFTNSEEEEEDGEEEEGEEEEGSEDNVLSFNEVNENVDLNEVQNILNVEEEVYVKEEERIYKNDLLYLKELETQILASYPVSKQGLLYIQEEVSREAQSMIDAKNDGLKRYVQYENGFEYPIVEDLFYNIYSNHWILPVVLDKHKVFSIIQENSEGVSEEKQNENSDSYIVESLEDQSGVKKESQVDQQILLKRIKHDASLRKISYKDLVKIFHKIQSPYHNDPKSEENKIGYFTKLQNNALVLRYYDIDSVHWNTRKINSDILSYKDKYDEETGRVIGITPYTLVGGEVSQIVGFMVLAKENDYDKKNLQSKKDQNIFQNPLTKKLVLSSKITKISQVGDFIKITAPNHGLLAKTRIYIDKSNCVPNINGMKQHLQITIENENEFSIKSSMKLNLDGTYGEIYTSNKLVYDRYKVNFNDQVDDYMVNFVGSTYGSDQTENVLHNKLYLFDEISVNTPEDFKKILVKVVPKLEQIIERESDRISQCYTFQDIENVLSKYNLKINDLKIDHVEFIKNILKSNLEKLKLEEEILKRESLPIFHIRNKDRFADKNFFLADIYITNPNVTKYYGSYDHLNKPEDCISIRLVWLMEQRDHGIIFFSEMMKMFYGLFKEGQNPQFIDSIIKEYETFTKNSEKQLNKETLIENQMRKNKNNKSKCCELYRFEVSTLKDLEKVETNNLENGTLALMDKEIYIWDNDLQTWNLSEVIPKYNSIQYLCTFKNTDLEELDLEALDSVYRKDFGCHSKLYIRFKERLTYVSQIHNNFVNLKNYLNDDIYIKYFDTQIENTVQKYYVEGKVEEENKKREEEEENIVVEKPKYDQLDVLIHKIYNLKDYDSQLNCIYNLIDKDGLLIGKDLYSKKYKRKIDSSYICGHFVYKNRERKATSQEKKNAIIEELVNLFGDQGEASGDVQTCTNCGQILTKYKDDDVEGYTENGQQIRSRDVWSKDEEEELPQTLAELESYDINIRTLDCDSKEFRKVFLEKGFKPDDIQHAKNVCIFLQNNLCSKTGITLREEDTVSIIIESLQKIRNMLNYKDFVSKEAKILMSTKGFGPDMIKRMLEEGKFLKQYELYQSIQTASIIASRFLITIQTAIPNYQHTAKLSPCVFTSFEGLDGIQYISCLLIEMGSIKSERSKDETMEACMKYVNDNYNEFKKSTFIHQLYLKKREYLIELSKKIASFNTSFIENIDIVYDDIGDLPENFVKELLEGKNIEQNYKKWKHRTNFLNQELKKIYMQVYNEAQLRDVNPESSIGISMIEKACCDEYLDDYMGFIYYIEDKSGNVSFGKMVQEVRDLYKLRYLFHQRGIYSRSIIKGPITDSYFSNNLPVYINPEKTNDIMISEKFATYIDQGPYMGTLRIYIGNGKDKKDTKTGQLYDEIISKKYTKDDYEKLLLHIAERKKRDLDTYTYGIYEIDNLVNLKRDVETLKDKQIQKLISSLTTILNKSSDKSFVEKYSNILMNIGYYQYYMTLNEKEKKGLSKKEVIKNNNKLVHIRLQYLKKCYNDYLRKYLSMIKNGKSRIQELQKLDDESLLPFEPNDYIAKEVQEFIYQSYESIEQFYDPTVRSYFLQTKLRNNVKMINSIHGEDDIYDSQHKEILKFANFSFKDASEIVHYLFIKELNDLILCNKGDEDEDDIDEGAEGENLTMNAASMDTQCKYRCMFIQFILDKIANDTEMLDLSTLDIERLKNQKNYSYLEQLQKAIEAVDSDDNTDYFTKQLQYSIYGKTQTTALPEEGAGEQMSDDQIKQQETVEMFVENAKAEYMEENGMEMPSDMLENMKEEYLDKMYNEELAEKENENVQDGEGEYGGIEVDADFTTDELAFAAEN